MDNKLNGYKEEIKTLIIYANIDNNYADNWLKLCNNKREHKEFLELLNFMDSNKIRVVIDITEDENKEDTINHYIDFLQSYDCSIISKSIEKGVAYHINIYSEDSDIYIIKD